MNKSLLVIALLLSVFVTLSAVSSIQANDFQSEQNEEFSQEDLNVLSEYEREVDHFFHKDENFGMEETQENPSSEDQGIEEFHRDAMTPEETPESVEPEEEDSEKRI